MNVGVVAWACVPHAVSDDGPAEVIRGRSKEALDSGEVEVPEQVGVRGEIAAEHLQNATYPLSVLVANSDAAIVASVFAIFSFSGAMFNAQSFCCCGSGRRGDTFAS